jgi:4-nitrophenyl phosphatase
MAAALAAAAGREPDAVIGKPSPEPILQIMREAGAKPEETVMVGDRYETDIAAGLAAGVAAWMVLTGIASELPEGQPGSADLRGLL